MITSRKELVSVEFEIKTKEGKVSRIEDIGA